MTKAQKLGAPSFFVTDESAAVVVDAVIALRRDRPC
jgi:hypothetical protein